MKTANWIQRNRSVAFIGTATAFSLLGDQVLYAVLPVYYDSLHLTPIQVGILLSANRWIRLLTNELAHRASTPGRERPLFLGAFVLGVMTTLAYALTTHFWLLLAARLAWGLAWSFIRHIGVQNIMSGVAGERVGRTMGMYNGFSRAGSVAGLLGGAVLVDLFGFSAGVMMLAVVSLLSLPLAVAGLRPEARINPSVALSGNVLPGALLVLGFTLGAVGPGFVMGTLGASIVVYVGAGGLFSAATLTGLLLGIRYLLDTALAPWLGGATDRYGVRRASMVYLCIGGLALVMASMRPPLAVFMVAIIVFFVCGTGLQAGVAGTASRQGSAAFARYVTASDFGSACGPLLGWLVVAWLSDPGLSLGLGGILYLLAIAPAIRLRL
ncbi:MAG: MFS transporter [Gammaproteobacteria bacterium]|nr:MAG: MFS transporter [Gammaproteobacteria bacterium]